MKKQYTASIILPFLLLLGGCVSGALSTPEAEFPPSLQANAVTSTAQPTHLSNTEPTKHQDIIALPSETPAPTQTTHPTQTPTNYAVPPIPPVFEDIPSCLKDGSPTALPEGFGFNGGFIYLSNERNEFHFAGGSPLAFVKMPVTKKSPDQKWYRGPFMSADGNWLILSPASYQKEWDHNISMLNAQKDFIEVALEIAPFIDRTPEWTRYVGVQGSRLYSDGTLSLRFIYQYGDEGPFTYLYGLYDLQQQTWKNDLLEQLPNYDPKSEAIFSPDMSRVVYHDGTHVVLWDVNHWEKIWATEFSEETIRYDWSGDSTSLIFYKYFVDRDGNQPKIITFPMTEAGEGIVFYFNYLSPDNRYIAYIGSLRIEDITFQLLIFDTSSETYIYRCEIRQFFNDAIKKPLLWSSDSNFLILAEGSEKLPVIYVHDLQQKQIYQLEQTGLPMGWSNDEGWLQTE
jgi:hypothetical protein